MSQTKGQMRSEHPPERRSARRLFVLLTAVVVLWLIAFPIREIGKLDFNYYRLQKAGIETKARVVLLGPERHQFVHYSFVVGSTEYQGIGHAGSGNPAFDNLSQGMQLTAFYLPKNPEVSCLGSPHELLVNDLIPFSAFLVTVVIVFIVRYRMLMKAVNNSIQQNAGHGSASSG